MTEEQIFLGLLFVPIFIIGMYMGRLYELFKRDHLLEQMRTLRLQRKQAIKLIKEGRKIRDKHAA